MEQNECIKKHPGWTMKHVQHQMHDRTELTNLDRPTIGTIQP